MKKEKERIQKMLAQEQKEREQEMKKGKERIQKMQEIQEQFKKEKEKIQKMLVKEQKESEQEMQEKQEEMKTEKDTAQGRNLCEGRMDKRTKKDWGTEGKEGKGKGDKEND